MTIIYRIICDTRTCAGYSFHYYFNEIDVSSFLKPGENTLAFHAYYQGLINRVWVSGDEQHRLMFELDIDGRCTTDLYHP